jgi:hypothetical protein
MKLRSLTLACCLLLFAHSLVAQTGTLAADPISGTWTGSMGRGEGDRLPITVTLKSDGKGLSGTIVGPPRPGTIRTGSFDQASGALKFDVIVQDDSKTVARFEGKVVNDTATGSVTLNGETGTFTMTKGAATATAPVQPQASGLGADAALQKSFAEVSGHVTKSADIIPAAKYTYRPINSVRTVGQLIAHIADGYNYFCAAAAGRKVEWSDAVEKGSTDKSTVVSKLKQATDACNAAYGGGGHPPLIENLGHTNLHYGNLITYMRMLGLVPPSSQAQ